VADAMDLRILTSESIDRTLLQYHIKQRIGHVMPIRTQEQARACDDNGMTIVNMRNAY